MAAGQIFIILTMCIVRWVWNGSRANFHYLNYEHMIMPDLLCFSVPMYCIFKYTIQRILDCFSRSKVSVWLICGSANLPSTLAII